MRYQKYGTCEQSVSAIGFGGMRFADPQDTGASSALVLHAHAAGITYFDTAPGYCQDLSESIMGTALSQVPRSSFCISTKSGAHDGTEVRESIERSCERLQVDSIDFFNIWCLMSADDLEERRRAGAIDAVQQAQADGLVTHLVCSSHMPGDQLAAVLHTGIFAGVTLGYNAVNFPYRAAAVHGAGRLGLGVVTMNPLGGGVIPRHPERFPHVAKADPDGDVVRAALRFNVSTPHVSVTLVGFANTHEVDHAAAAVRDWQLWTEEQRHSIQEQAAATFDDLCTGCGYCEPCPQDIPIPQIMDAWNQAILSGNENAARQRLESHWHLSGNNAATCTACGRCEELCTQHLPIVERLRALAGEKT